MSLQTIDCEQRSEEWFQARYGIPSASGFSNIVTTKGELSKSYKKYMYKLAGERVSCSSEETYQSAAMLRGIELEAEAIECYELITGHKVEKTGFIIKDGSGGSPDGLVGEDGGIEVKCPLMGG